MITGGFGGANTQTGAMFEMMTDLKKNLINAGIDLKDVIFLKQTAFPKYMKEHNFDMTENFGKKFQPDEAFIYHNHLYVIEKKYQCVKGSVDEKIQTGPYKKLIYDTCAKVLGLNGATYIYLLKGDAFNINKYTKHQIPYLKNNGIPVYFDNFPIDKYFDIAA